MVFSTRQRLCEWNEDATDEPVIISLQCRQIAFRRSTDDGLTAESFPLLKVASCGNTFLENVIPTTLLIFSPQTAQSTDFFPPAFLSLAHELLVYLVSLDLFH